MERVLRTLTFDTHTHTHSWHTHTCWTRIHTPKCASMNYTYTHSDVIGARTPTHLTRIHTRILCLTTVSACLAETAQPFDTYTHAHLGHTKCMAMVAKGRLEIDIHVRN